MSNDRFAYGAMIRAGGESDRAVRARLHRWKEQSIARANTCPECETVDKLTFVSVDSAGTIYECEDCHTRLRWSSGWDLATGTSST